MVHIVKGRVHKSLFGFNPSFEIFGIIHGHVALALKEILFCLCFKQIDHSMLLM